MASLCIALHCIALHCIALHCIALHCIALHCIALHCVAFRCIALHCIALHCIALYRIALHCIALHCIALHCIALHCIALHYIVQLCIRCLLLINCIPSSFTQFKRHVLMTLPTQTPPPHATLSLPMPPPSLLGHAAPVLTVFYISSYFCLNDRMLQKKSQPSPKYSTLVALGRIYIR